MLAENVINMGSRVSLHYTLALAEGRVIDSSRDGEALTIIVGQGDIAAGLEKYLIGLAVGDRRRFEIPAGEVYGQPGPGVLSTFAREDFPPEVMLQPGQVIGFALPSGEEVPAIVMALDDAGVHVDFSHPLAAHALVFDVEILALLTRPSHARSL